MGQRCLPTISLAPHSERGRCLWVDGVDKVGVFRNDFARQMLSASVSAGIEAPIRFYVTENPDGTATLSYKKPGFVFAPYIEDDERELTRCAKIGNSVGFTDCASL